MIEIIRHSAAAEAPSAPSRGRSEVATALSRRVVPIALIMATVGTAMAYSLWWGPLFGHADWITPGDLWGTFHTSQFVAWGNIGSVYSGGGGLVSLPGISVLLAPVALVVNHFGLSVGFPSGLPHPSAWLLLGPYEVALGALVLVPLDALAEELKVSASGRVIASICEAALLWPVLVIWGHPEDSVAMALAVWGLLAALRGRWRNAGWIWGLSLVMQPLVVLMVPILFALAPRRAWPKLFVRSALPSVALVAIPLAQSWRQTTTALLKQPNYPTIDHATPWLAFAPVLSKTHPVRAKHISEAVAPNGAVHFVVSTVRSVAGETVAAGPGRMIAIFLAVLIGVFVYRRRPGPEHVVWLCCVALSLRCVFEAVMNPYYLWPPLAIAFVLVVRDRFRFVLAFAAAAGLTVWSYRHIGPWAWWAPMGLLLAIVVASAAPVPVVSRSRADSERPTEEPDTRVLVDVSA